MKKGRFDRLVASLGEVRDHRHWAFRWTDCKVAVGPGDIRAVRERPNDLQQFAATRYRPGTCRSGARRRRPSGGAKSPPAAGRSSSGVSADELPTPCRASVEPRSVTGKMFRPALPIALPPSFSFIHLTIVVRFRPPACRAWPMWWPWDRCGPPSGRHAHQEIDVRLAPDRRVCR